jgi:hypothetical protein
MKHLLSFDEWLVESTSGEIFKPKRNHPMEFDPKKHPELANEFFELISTAYAEIGGHAKIKTPADIFADPDWNFWEGVDIHGNDNFDIIMFGQKTRYGIKFSGVGHDGTKDAKRAYVASRGKDLHQPGYYVEVSDKIAAILIDKYGCPIVGNQEDVEKVLGKHVEWFGKHPDDKSMPGNGWYLRQIGGHPHAKILLGRPKV